jgi:hypothetical protein
LVSGAAARAIGVLAIAMLGRSFAIAQSPPIAWEYTPYRIHALVTTSHDLDANGILAADLAEELARRAKAVVGAPWNLTASAADPRERRWVERSLREVDGGDPRKEPPEWNREPIDKLLVVSVSSGPIQWSVAAREFDFRVRSWRPIVNEDIDQPRRAGSQALSACWAAFAPVARVERTEGNQANLHFQASGLAYRDRALAGVSTGDVLEPFLRRPGRGDATDGANVVSIPWTFLRVVDVEGDVARAEIVTGVRSPLSTTLRGGTEILAVAARAAPREAILSLQLADAAATPLVGYEVRAEATGDTLESTSLGFTDEAGQVVVPSLEGPLASLLILHGDRLAARLPLAPGLHSRLAARLADDSATAAIEAAALALMDELMDAVVRREVLMAQIRRWMERGESQRARDELDVLRRLPRRQQFERSVVQLRQRAANLAPGARGSIDAQLESIVQAAGEHLDSRDIERLAAELGGAPNPTRPNSAN